MNRGTSRNTSPVKGSKSDNRSTSSSNIFDDEVERLSLFDPLTGEVLRDVPRFTVYPKTHYVTPRETIVNAADAIQIELNERLEQLRSRDKLVS